MKLSPHLGGKWGLDIRSLLSFQWFWNLWPDKRGVCQQIHVYMNDNQPVLTRVRNLLTNISKLLTYGTNFTPIETGSSAFCKKKINWHNFSYDPAINNCHEFIQKFLKDVKVNVRELPFTIGDTIKLALLLLPPSKIGWKYKRRDNECFHTILNEQSLKKMTGPTTSMEETKRNKKSPTVNWAIMFLKDASFSNNKILVVILIKD